MHAAVVDTADKTDRILGNRPEGLYGHMMPFFGLYKSEIFKLAHFLNIPDQLIIQPPDLEKLDLILYLLVEKEQTPEQISQELHIDLNWIKKLKLSLNKHYLNPPTSQFMI